MSLPAQTPHSKTQIEQAEPAVGRLESLQTASAIDPIRPLRVHGLDLSYFTGKLEATLRAKGLPYELVAMDTRRFRTMGKRMGIAQMPHLELPDGQILTDTSCILKWLEAHHPEPALMPVDPALCWIADLLEDFADEWLWRPALYYRWAFAADARLLSERLARGMLRDINAPVALRRWFILQRQRHVYLRKDGVSPHNAKAIEAIYHDTLDALCVALAQRPFLLGNRPTQADCGFFGPFFRHFSSDPTPSQILRERAPAALAWVGRVWNLQPGQFSHQPQPRGDDPLPAALGPLMRLVVGEYLPYLVENEISWAAGKPKHDWTCRGSQFSTPVSPYRIWCWQNLRENFQALSLQNRERITIWVSSQCGEALARVFDALVTQPLAPGRHAGPAPWLDRPSAKAQHPITTLARRQGPFDRHWRRA